MGSSCGLHRDALRYGSPGGRRPIINRYLFQEFEYSHVHDVASARAHVMAATRHELAFDIRNEPTRALEGQCRIRYDFLVADEQ